MISASSPSTLGEDGDPLDILVLMEASVIPGCVIRALLVGAIEGDLRPHLLDEIKEFFVSYNKLRDRKFRTTHDASPDKARKLIEEGMKTFKKKRRKAA